MAGCRGAPAGRRSVVVCGAVLLAVAGNLHAANTGSLAGAVLDSDGEPLPGVTVQITSDILIGGPRIALSRPDGRFAFHLLQVGIYTAEASLPGFMTATGEVRVQANGVGSVAFRMIPGSFHGEIEVNADVPVVDTSQVNAGVVFDEDYLRMASVGADGRSYLSFLGQAPGVARGPANNPQVFGSTQGENAYLIDGVNTTDPLVGTWGVRFNIDAVQELNFQTGGFEAEFGQATGGIVNLVTKSGGNRFSGSFDARYRNQNMIENGEHFDKDDLTSSFQNYSATLGGPILRDRLWFFTSLQYGQASEQGTYAYFPRENENSQLLGKTTWQATEGNRLILKYSTDPLEITGSNSSPFVLESAMATWEQGGDILHFELDSVLSPSWLLTAQLSYKSGGIFAHPTNRPETVSGHENEDTRLQYNNHWTHDENDRSRTEGRVHASWFVDDLAGSHEFKGGIEYARLRSDDVTFLTGGAWVVDFEPPGEPIDLNGDGYINRRVWLDLPEDSVRDEITQSGDIGSFFIQDTWRPTPNVTIKPGFRLDRVIHHNNAGELTADMSRWQPRLGLAWDLFGNARHIVRLSAGRFMDPTALTIPIYAAGSNRYEQEYATLESLCNQTHGLYCTVESLPPTYDDPIYWTNWDGQQYVLIKELGHDPGSTRMTVDTAGLGRLRAPYSDQLILAYETQLAPETSLEFSFVDKRTEDIIEDTCSNNSWAFGQGEPPDIDDPSTWTTAGGCQTTVFANIPQLTRTYRAFITKFETRKNWGHLLFSYTNSEAKGNSLSGPRYYHTSFANHFPVDFYNHEGYLPYHRRHRVKLNGYLLLPKRFTIGVGGFWSSPGHETVFSSCGDFRDAIGVRSTEEQMSALGIDQATLEYCFTGDGVFLEDARIFHSPLGSLTTKSVWQVDLQFSKTFKIGPTEMTPVLTVYNLFGHEWDMSFNSSAFLQDTDEDGNGLRYQDTDPSAPYYDEYYGADNSPVLIPIGEPLGYRLPRRYEIGFRIEF